MYFRTNLTCLKRLTFLSNWRMAILPRFNCISLILILKKWPDPLCFQIFCKSARKRFEISFSFWLLLAINTKKEWDFSWLAFSSYAYLGLIIDQPLIQSLKVQIFQTRFHDKDCVTVFKGTWQWRRLNIWWRIIECTYYRTSLFLGKNSLMSHVDRKYIKGF